MRTRNPDQGGLYKYQCEQLMHAYTEELRYGSNRMVFNYNVIN